MNLKKGDIVICINNGDEGDTISLPRLTLNKRYVVDGVKGRFVTIKNDLDISYSYYSFRFANICDIRKTKIEKLNSIV